MVASRDRRKGIPDSVGGNEGKIKKKNVACGLFGEPSIPKARVIPDIRALEFSTYHESDKWDCYTLAWAVRSEESKAETWSLMSWRR